MQTPARCYNCWDRGPNKLYTFLSWYLFLLFLFIRERLIRLQHENKILKLNQEGSDNEKIALLQSLLEDANSRKNELETENRSRSWYSPGWNSFCGRYYHFWVVLCVLQLFLDYFQFSNPKMISAYHVLYNSIRILYCLKCCFLIFHK